MGENERGTRPGQVVGCPDSSGMFRSTDQGVMNTMNDFIPRVEQSGPSTGGPGAPGKPGPVAKLVGMLAGIALLAGAVLFSAVLLVVLLAAGTVVLGWFWWHTRAVRRALREQMRADASRQPAGQPGQPGQPGPARPLDAASVPLARRQADVADAQILSEDTQPPPRP